jgi:hypothetical protein
MSSGARVGFSQPFFRQTRAAQIFDALPRSHLFSLLDEAAGRPIVWVCGPPGAGRTTLVLSYRQARRLRHFWLTGLTAALCRCPLLAQPQADVSRPRNVLGCGTKGVGVASPSEARLIDGEGQ